jgi:cold shock CspA family protein
MLGTVIKYDRITAVGWILSDDPTLPDFFVIPKFMLEDKRHRFLMAGWRVEFDAIDIDGNPQAHNVRIISRPIAIQRSAPQMGERPSECVCVNIGPKNTRPQSGPGSGHPHPSHWNDAPKSGGRP